VSIALTDVRFQIQDQPRTFGAQPESPRVCGTADGNNTIFYLPLGPLQYVAGSAALFAVTIGSAPVGISPSAYTITQQGMVTFSIAPGAGGSGITTGQTIAASFQATAFADADLTNVMNRNVALYPSDEWALKGCTLDIINVLLANTDKLAATREAEYEKDPAAVIAALVKLKDFLMDEIEGAPRPGRAQPVLMMYGRRQHPYQPVR
jgi:hypothetical protein